jgi:hypothetical protein
LFDPALRGVLFPELGNERELRENSRLRRCLQPRFSRTEPLTKLYKQRNILHIQPA